MKNIFYLNKISKFCRFWFKDYPKFPEELKKKRKTYMKQRRHYKKMLRNAVKNYEPWDYGYMLSFIKIIVEHWCEYYELGYNVDGQETKDDTPSRLEIAEHLKILYEDFEKCEMFCRDDDTAIKNLFNYLGEYILYMWD